MVSGQCGVPQWPGTTRLSRGILQQRGYVPPPVAALGGNGTSPLDPARCAVVSGSGHGGIPPCPNSTKLSRGVRAVVVHARYGHPLRFYITPHCPQCPPVAALKLRLVSVTALRPSGEGNRRYAKWPSLERSPAACTPQPLRVLRAVACRPCGVLALWHMSGAARMVLVSGFAVYLVFAPAHPWGLLASQHRPRGLPVRPPRGLPQDRAKKRPLSAACSFLLVTVAPIDLLHPLHAA